MKLYGYFKLILYRDKRIKLLVNGWWYNVIMLFIV